MKFSEKLQKMRKENKLSQEQLADMLEVSRQAVSKWESGQTYPEMDKLLSLCKIFKCSLDDLTNDEVVEIKTTEKGKVTVSNLVDEVFDIIHKSIDMFKKMPTNKILACIFEMFVIFLILLILKMPVEYVYDLGRTIFMTFGVQAGQILSSIWNFILSISYLIFAIVCFFYIYKVQFLEKWSQLNIEEPPVLKEKKENTSDGGQTENQPQMQVQEIVYQAPQVREPSVILKVLSKMVTVFAKGCVFVISSPFLLFFLFLVMAFAIGVLLLFRGIFYIGVLILILSGAFLDYMLIELMFNFIFSRKTNVKKVFIIFMGSLIGLGVGAGITTVEITGTKFYDKVPPKYQEKTISKELSMTDKLCFTDVYGYSNVQYIEDNNMKDRVLVKVSYYDDIQTVTIESTNEDQFLIMSSDRSVFFQSKMFEELLKDLAKKQIHNYSKLAEKQIEIIATKENIEKIKKNEEEKWYHDRLEASIPYEIENENLQQQLEEKEMEIINLKDKIYRQEQEIEDYQQKLQEYKDRLHELLSE